MKRGWLLWIPILWISQAAYATERDFAIWSFVGVNKKMTKVVNFYGEAEYRSREKVRVTDCWALYGELSAKVFSFLRMGGGYTYTHYNHPSLSWEPRHRLNLFTTGSFSYSNWSFAIRERYETVFRMLTDKTKPMPTPKQTLRSRIEANYRIPNSIFFPYATIELYTLMNSSNGIENEKVRYTLGTQMLLNKQTSLILYYRYIAAFATQTVDSQILGVGVRFSL